MTFCTICFIHGERHDESHTPTEHIAFVTEGGGFSIPHRDRFYFCVRVPRPVANLLKKVFP